ncbi:MAG: DNA methylase, partial [Candidatus Hodarchaeota archaeon]
EKRSKTFYETALIQAFSEIRRTLKSEGLLVIMFTHRSTQAWESLIKSVLKAGFYATASWPVQTELGNRLQAIGRKGQATVNSTILLVCRKQKIERIGYFEDIKATLKEQVTTKLNAFWKAGIRGADFFISSIGPLIEIFGQYTQIQKLSGEPVSIDELFTLLRSEVANFVMTQLFDDFSMKVLDKKTKFYLIYKWAYPSQKTAYDEINKLVKAVGGEEQEIFGKKGLLLKRGAKVHPVDPLKRMKDHEDAKDLNALIDMLHLMALWWAEESLEQLKTFLSQNKIGLKHPVWRVAQALCEILPAGNKEKQVLQALLGLPFLSP